MNIYHILVQFKSNEHPWSGTDTPLRNHQPKTDEEAKEWAQYMQDKMEDYTITLFKNGEVLKCDT